MSRLLDRMVSLLDHRRRQGQVDQSQLAWPPGHYYSPIPNLTVIRSREDAIFRVPRSVPGIELHSREQLDLVDALSRYHDDQPFFGQRSPGLRYFYENDYFSYADGIVLHCLLRHLRPARIVEIGSGHSSALILDTRDRFLDGDLSCTFIDPDPQRLYELAFAGEQRKLDIVPREVQEVDLELFLALRAGDILLIDSTHVSKTGSDVNHIVFNVLPILASGVYVHFHDIYYPFEYPREWVYQGRAWNEAYLVRSFLQYNDAFSITLFNSYLAVLHRVAVIERLPLFSRSAASSLWLRKR